MTDNTADAAGMIGNFALINSGQGPREFFYQTVSNLCAAATYQVSFAVANATYDDGTGCIYGNQPSIDAYTFPAGTGFQSESSDKSASFSATGGTLKKSTGSLPCTMRAVDGGPGLVWNTFSFNFTGVTSIDLVLVSLGGNTAGYDFETLLIVPVCMLQQSFLFAIHI